MLKRIILFKESLNSFESVAGGCLIQLLASILLI
jgi:hypothetical protein